MLKAQKKAVEAPVAEAKAAVQKAVAKPAAAVKQEANKTASKFESKKAEVQKAVQKPVAEARTLLKALFSLLSSYDMCRMGVRGMLQGCQVLKLP